MAMTQHDKGAAFRALHEGPAFLLPNPWDAGSAKVLAGLGFAALATTSSGMAHALGRDDGAVSLDDVVAHVELVAAATDLPLSVDLENGHDDPAQAIRRVAAAGAVGASIEDYDPVAQRLYDVGEAAERIAAAAAAARALDVPFTLTGRAENHIRANPDRADTIARLQAYAEAGADVLYAPGLREADDIAAVAGAVGRPLNVLLLAGMAPGPVAAAGARRMSVGGGLAWAAVNGLVDAARALQQGDAPAAMRAPAELGDWLT
jgi:2-methylisocitrate lyase-like PEP mutase family enzyme